MDNKFKIVVITGPTATGKSALALHLCRRYNGELVGADSMQIYKGLVIGTAAITEYEAQGVTQHLVGHVLPSETYSAANYVEDAKTAIEEVTSRGKLPIICGGTGLYLSSLIEGISFAPKASDEKLRSKLWDMYDTYGGEYMLQQLANVDPEYAAKQHVSNIKRILRGIELNQLTGLTMAQNNEKSRPSTLPYNALSFCLNIEPRDKLYQRIEQRVDRMLEKGLLNEAKMVYQHKDTYITATQAIGYKEFFPYFEKISTLEECTATLKQATRRYAKRQLTWFKKMPQLQWKDALNKDLQTDIENKVESFL